MYIFSPVGPVQPILHQKGAHDGVTLNQVVCSKVKVAKDLCVKSLFGAYYLSLSPIYIVRSYLTQGLIL